MSFAGLLFVKLKNDLIFCIYLPVVWKAQRTHVISNNLNIQTVSIGIFKRTKKRGGTNLVNNLGLGLNLNYNFLLYPLGEQCFVCVFVVVVLLCFIPGFYW